MSKAIALLDMPSTCTECFFNGASQYFHTDNNLYKKVGRCLIAPDDIEDPWRDVHWQLDNKEEWCPLKPVPEEQYVWYDDETSDWERGYNSCLHEIVGDQE